MHLKDICSGTEVWFSTAKEYYTDDFMAWVFHFVQKVIPVPTICIHFHCMSSIMQYK